MPIPTTPHQGHHPIVEDQGLIAVNLHDAAQAPGPAEFSLTVHTIPIQLPAQPPHLKSEHPGGTAATDGPKNPAATGKPGDQPPHHPAPHPGTRVLHAKGGTGIVEAAKRL